MPLLLFILLPLLEIAGFVIVGDWLGVVPVLLLVIATTVAGIVLIRRHGLRRLADLQQADRIDPLAPLAQALATVLAGILLILPGFITDLLGVALLIPPLRRGLWRLLGPQVRVMRPHAGYAATDAGTNSGDIIDGEATEITPDRPLPPSGWTRPPGSA